MVTDAYSVREGLGEAAAFYRSHPLLNFSYFAIVIGVTMFATVSYTHLDVYKRQPQR